jgi:glutathione S-transferase
MPDPPRLRLFGTRLSPFVEKVALALEYKRLAFELVEPRSPTDFRRHNPQTAKMPALEIGEERHYDSTFILRALDARFPDPPLFSRDPRAAASQRQLEDWSDESLYWQLMALRWSRPNRAATTRQIVETLPAALRPIARLLVPRQIGRTPWVQGFGRLPYEVIVRELGRSFDDLAQILDGSPFFFGERPSAADLALTGQLAMGRSGPTPEVEKLLGERPAIAEHARRVLEAVRG